MKIELFFFKALLSAPNPDDPLANDVAELWKVLLYDIRIKNDDFEELVLSISSKFVIKSNLTLFQMNEAEALKNARDWTRKYAMGSGAGP